MSVTSSSSSDLDASWKTALNSKRRGSFMFPEDVVVEELLAHIDNTWNSLWEGISMTVQPFDELDV